MTAQAVTTRGLRARPIRVAHLVSHPIQYFAPLYRALAGDPSLALTVFFYSDATLRGFHDREFDRDIAWDSDLTGGYDARFVPSARGRSLHQARGMTARPNLDLVRELDRGAFDAVWVHGYAHPNAFLARGVAARRRIPFLLRDEANHLYGRDTWRRLAKALPLRGLLRGANVLYIGSENRRYFASYGVPDDRMFFAPYSVDEAALRAARVRLLPERDALRARFGVTDGRPLLLFCGKVAHKKRPLEVLEAFRRVRRDTACALLVVGDGELAPVMRARVAEHQIPDVHFTGFLNQAELPAAYTAADALVLFSGDFETWGLVVNEAMTFGCAVVASDRVGSAHDLVGPDNGAVVPAGDVEGLAGALRRLCVPGIVTQFGEVSERRVGEYGLVATAAGIRQALHATAR